MKAIRFEIFGSPDVLTIANLATPVVAETEALIRIEAVPINPFDVNNLAGAMSQTTPRGRPAGITPPLRGRVVELSATGKREVSFNHADFYHNETRLSGVDMLKMGLTDAAKVLEHLRPGFESGDYRPAPIARLFPLAEAVAAYKAVAAGERGRVVLRPQA